MPADGQLEHDAIIARASALFGGRIVDGGVPDDERPALPYLTVISLTPIAKARGRGIGVTEAGQPHVMPVMFELAADDPSTASRGMRQVFAHFVGWTPDPNDSGEMTSYGSAGLPVFDPRSAPSRWTSILRMAVEINKAV
jgi:hypothetical protein